MNCSPVSGSRQDGWPSRYDWLLLAEGHLTRRLFGAILDLIWALPVPTG